MTLLVIYDSDSAAPTLFATSLQAVAYLAAVIAAGVDGKLTRCQLISVCKVVDASTYSCVL